MSRIGLSNFAAALRPSTIHWYNRGMKRNPFLFDGIFKVEQQDEGVHRDQLLVGLGTMIPTTDGGNTPFDSVNQSFKTDYVPTGFRLGTYVTSDLIDDGKGIGVAELITTSLSAAWQDTKNRLCANVLNRAGTSGYVGGDGLTLLNTAHVYGGGGTYTNRHSTDADLSELAIEQLLIDMGDAADDRQLLVPVRSRMLVVNPSNQFEAERILNSTKQVYSADNTANAILNMGMFPENYRSISYLDDDDAWFIMTDRVDQGLKLMIRKDLEISNDVDFQSDSVLIKGHARAVAGWTDPLAVFGSLGT